jgi:ABC-2 type transport system ATP-binding protein
VSRSFGDVQAVQDVSLEVQRGTILGVIGPSGSGKTTLVRMMTGVLEQTSGEIRVLGEDPRKFHRQTRETIGYMPQLFVLYPDLTVQENVSFVASLFGLLWRRRRRRVRQVLQFVELWDVRHRRAKDLSGGMQRRLELACALVHEPALMFVDEPTAGLDPVLRQTIWTEFRRLRDLGRTMVVTTQYVAEAEHCDEVAVLEQGQLIAREAPEDLRRDAMGGDVIEIETTRAIDASAVLAHVPGVIEVRQSSPRRLRVVAEEAGSATPRVLEAISDQGVEIASSTEYRPSFDEVFAELIARRRTEAGDGSR